MYLQSLFVDCELKVWKDFRKIFHTFLENSPFEGKNTRGVEKSPRFFPHLFV